MGEIFTAEIAEAAEKRLKKIGHRRTRTHTDNRAGRSKAKGQREKNHRGDAKGAEKRLKLKGNWPQTLKVKGER